MRSRPLVPVALACAVLVVLGGCATQSARDGSEGISRRAADGVAAAPQAWYDIATGQTPSDGDLRAVQLTYPTGRFEPQWLVESAREAHAVETGIPHGSEATPDRGKFFTGNETFTALGPQPLNPGASAAAGRVNAIVVDPVDPTIAYFGSDGGGVWKTTNCCSAATTWTVKTDLPEIANIAIGDLAIDPGNRNTIYAGTGDLRFGSFSFGAAGLLKSTDRGETWTVLGMDVFNPFYGPSAGLGFPQYQAIGKVVVDPNESRNVIVGTKTGLFVSNDAGQSWAGPCLTNPHTTQRQDTTGLLAIDAGATTTLIAAIGARGMPTPVQPNLDQNGANGVYRATLPLSGCPTGWALLNNNWPVGTGNGTAGATSNGRIEIALAPSNTQVLYAQISDTNLSNGIVGVWRSQNQGTTWTQVGTDNAYAGQEGTQLWYNAGLTVHPTNPDIVLSGTLNLFRSQNGGATFSRIGGTNMHVDHHARAYAGNDSNELLVGNDGGMWLSTNAAAASPTFVPLNNTINTIEFYSGDITANFATATVRGASGGAQDNGSNTVQWFGGVQPGPSAWETRNGGDGIYTRIEPVLGRRWYYSSQNGALVVALAGPGGATQDASAPALWGGDRLSFVMPIELYRYGALDAPGSGCTTAIGCSHMLGGTSRVWETIFGGAPANSWYPNSPDLTKGTLEARSFINQLAHSVTDPRIAIAGTNDGNVWYGFGLGGGAANTATWVNVTAGNTLLPNRPIMDVATDPLDPRIGYAPVGGFNQNTPAQPGHVFQVACTGDCASFVWSDKTGNLPNIPANSIVANPLDRAQVFAGTDWGLYYTNNIDAAAPQWLRHEGLPHSMVWDMAIDRGFTTLAVFTRSRGAWITPLPAASAAPQLPASNNLFDARRDGHGIDFTRVRDNLYALTFYTYGANGEPEWYQALGNMVNGVFVPFTGSDGKSLIRYRYTAGNTPPQVPVSAQSGTVALDFNNPASQAPCNDGRPTTNAVAVMTFTLGADQNVRWCMEPIVAATARPAINFSGLWFAGSADDGWGWSILNFTAGATVSTYGLLFYYDASGNPVWSYSLHNGVMPNSPTSIIHRRGYCRTCTATPFVDAVAGSVTFGFTQPSESAVANNRVTYSSTPQNSVGGTFARSNSPFVLLTTPQ